LGHSLPGSLQAGFQACVHVYVVIGLSLSRASQRKNSEQVSHTSVPLSSSSIIWYWPKGSDAWWLGR